MEDLKFWMTITFLSILIFVMGLFITKSIKHSVFLISFILSIFYIKFFITNVNNLIKWNYFNYKKDSIKFKE